MAITNNNGEATFTASHRQLNEDEHDALVLRVEALETGDNVTQMFGVLIGDAPESLNTLNELAAALGDDGDFANTVLNSLGDRYTKAEVDALQATQDTATSTVASNLTQEIVDRTFAVAGVQGDIDAYSAYSAQEVLDRIAGDNTITASLAQEIIDRASGDNAIDARLVIAEVAVAADAFSIAANTTAISNEVSNRISADSAISLTVGTNTASIAAVSTTTGTNTTNIGTNVTNIATNVTNISGIDGRVTTLEGITSVDGTGTANKISKWSDADTIADSNITDDGTNVDVTGTLRVTGDVIAYYSSDARLKSSVFPICNAVEKVKVLGGYSYYWNDKQDTYTGKDIGVIAQEVEAVFPEAVSTRDNGYKAVQYHKLVAVLIEAVKELSDRIETLENK